MILFFRYTKNTFSDLIIVQRKMGTLGRVMVTYEKNEVTDGKTKPNSKVVGTVEFKEGELTQPIEFVLIDQDESENYPKLFSLTLISTLLLTELPNLNINQSILNESVGILPKIGIKNTIYIKVVDRKSIVEFAQDSQEIFATFGHNFGQTVTLNIDLSQMIVSYPHTTGKYFFLIEL